MADSEPSSSSSDGDAIKVVVRVRPPAANLTELGDPGMCLEVDNEAKQIRMQCKPEHKVFTFDQVADHNSTQESIFDSLGRTTVESCLAGYNGTIFAYGQTGSGKTFTMLGPAENSENFQHELRGVIPRSFEYLFNMIKTEQEQNGDSVQFLCKCSFLEIYNEQIFDLLDGGCMGLQLRESIKCGVFVDGLTEQSVEDATEAYECLTSGWMNRTVASTSMNRESSRSHAVFTVHIESKKYKDGMWKVRSSQLHLVDLAGSERQKDTKAEGLRLKEATRINRSLSTLGNCIMALVDIAHGKTRHIPYRDSKLSFLLKDALGGNTKTYIIACVHPGARCFGETLSTLQFARRAKMIKNKAVVNEDMHGSVACLQAEIRKYKDLLAQYQAGSIPVVPSTGEPGKAPPCTDDESEYKHNFLQSMYFRQQVISDKKILHEKYRRLQEMYNRKEQALRQNKMILKFREDALKKYEKSQKENTPVSDDENLEIIASLREEIRMLEDRLSHHPEVTQYRLETENLRTEVRRLKAENTHRDIDIQRATRLQQIFEQLVAENDQDKVSGADRRISIGTPQNGSDVTASTATTDRHKTLITKLQAEVETLRRELGGEKEQSQREAVERESEIISLRKAKEEVEKNLNAHRIRYQVERDNMEETMRDMTTPKKARYLLRNRTIMVPASGRLTDQPVLDMNGSFTEEDYLPMESLPQEYFEEKIEPLLEQIKKIQEENHFLHAQRDNLESQVVQQVEEVSRIESQKELTEQLYNKDKAAWVQREEQLTGQLKVANSELHHLREERTVLYGEVQDLRLMYDAAEKRYKEARDSAKLHKAEREKDVGTLQTKGVQMELELTKIQREHDQLREEQVTLRESEENCQLTLDFTQEKLGQAEQSLIQANKANMELEAKIAAANERIDQETANNHKLCAQMHQRGDQEQKLAEALSQMEKSQAELRHLQDRLQTTKQAEEAVRSELSKATEENVRLAQAQVEYKDMIGLLQGQLSSKKEQHNDHQHQIDSLSKQLEEYAQANINLVADNEQLAKVKAEELAVLECEIQKHIAQFEVQQCDLEEMVEDKDDLMKNLSQQHDDNNILVAKNEELKKTINEMQEKNDELTSQLMDLKQSLETTSTEKQEVLEKQMEITWWQNKAEEYERRAAELLGAFDTVSSQHQQQAIRGIELEEQLALYKAKDQEHEATLRQSSCQSETRIQGLVADIEELTEENKEKTDKIARLQETLKVKLQQSEEIQILCQEFTSRNKQLETESETLRERVHREAEEKAQLAGNHNHAARIKYLDKINNERHEISKKYQQLISEHQNLKTKYEALKIHSRTPTKAALGISARTRTPLKPLLTSDTSTPDKANRSGTPLKTTGQSSDVSALNRDGTPLKSSVQGVTNRDGTPLKTDFQNSAASSGSLQETDTDVTQENVSGTTDQVDIVSKENIEPAI